MKDEAPNRRQSNEGFRKLDLDDRVLIFLQRLRRKTTFQELGYLYGCGQESARRYFGEMVKIFHTHFVPRLVFPRSPEQLRKMSREQVLNQFPDLLAILDATNWEQLKPENFLENRLSYSAFKHMNAFQVLLGEGLVAVVQFWAEKPGLIVVSTERLILWRSEIFGGISNEISVLLDQSTLPGEMKGLSFGSGTKFCFTYFFVLQRKAISRNWRRTQRR